MQYKNVEEYDGDFNAFLPKSDYDKVLAERCALWHDIARFKQWTEYKTFVDYESFDHGFYLLSLKIDIITLLYLIN